MSHLVIISWLAAMPGNMQLFKDHLTGLRDKPGYDQLLAVVHNWIVSLYIKPSNIGEHCILCAHKDGLGLSSNTVSSVL